VVLVANVAVALFVGPAHVCARVNDSFVELYPGREMVGIPVREAIAEAEFRDLFDLMDECYRTRQEIWCAFRGGTLGVLPRENGGVAICLGPSAGPTRIHVVSA